MSDDKDAALTLMFARTAERPADERFVAAVRAETAHHRRVRLIALALIGVLAVIALAALAGPFAQMLGALEDSDALVRRVDEAARYAPLEQLALSPQCGFASTYLGNLLTEDDEKRKLELVAKTAERIWGSA